ncbi:MAG: helix-turn-helix transcriptional regulator [Trueperella sp.]|nr:helix-turn-helix transcriptional regulator [Trueperella sp.]
MKEHSPAERALASALAKSLIRRRKELGKTQEEVALIAGIDRNHYQLMEHARADRKSNSPANPQLNTLVGISKALEITVADLLTDALAEYEKYDQ